MLNSYKYNTYCRYTIFITYSNLSLSKKSLLIACHIFKLVDIMAAVRLN